MMAFIGIAASGLLLAGLYLSNRHHLRRAEARFPPLGETVEVEGIRLHYVSKGSGPPVVFLHGGILSVHDYLPVLELAGREWRAIAFDRPGYGYSERPSRETATPDVQARLLRGALKRLGAEKPVLVGHSMSGAHVLAYALAYPDDLSGIVLLAPAAFGGEAYPAGKVDSFFYHLVKAPVVGPLLLGTVLPPLARLLVKPSVTAAFAPDPVPPDYMDAALALWPRPGQAKANREDVATFRASVEPLSHRYGEIRVPVVIVVGDADPFRPDLQSHALHRAIPHSRLIVLPGTGHMIPRVRPEAVVEAVRHIWRDRTGTA